jgi:hypothetical protein
MNNKKNAKKRYRDFGSPALRHKVYIIISPGMIVSEGTGECHALRNTLFYGANSGVFRI